MSIEESDRKHLSPRQIVNRFKKGEYVDESIEAISSAISSCGKYFDSVTIPFPTSIIEKVFENIDIAKTLYERQKAGASIDDITFLDIPQLKDILMDLSHPGLWESMQTDSLDDAFWDITRERNLRGKYHLDTGYGDSRKVIGVFSRAYRSNIEQAGLSYFSFDWALSIIIK